MRRTIGVILCACLVLLGVAAYATGECADYLDSTPTYFPGYGVICAGWGPGCTECWDENGGSCHTEYGGSCHPIVHQRD